MLSVTGYSAKVCWNGEERNVGSMVRNLVYDPELEHDLENNYPAPQDIICVECPRWPNKIKTIASQLQYQYLC